MKVLLLGSGGREHALAWKLAQSPRLTKLWAAPGSDAIAAHAERAALDVLAPDAVAAFCRERGVELLVVGPEAPLAAGVADAVRAAGVAVFGPGKDGARLESSKAHAKDFMARHGLPTAASRTAASPEQAKAAARAFAGKCAVKADGLAGGKGVVVCDGVAEADAAIELLAAGAAGRVLVVEEKLSGPEVSVLALLDGTRWSALAPSQDHKRLLDGDRGPNTGGMGAYAPAPVDAADWKKIEAVLDGAVAGLQKDGVDYRGVLYAGLMMTDAGPKLLEFNARFGDPETQEVLPLLDADLLELLHACATGRGPSGRLPQKPGAAVGVVLAAEGYPEKPVPGAAIDLSGVDSTPEVLLFHAGTSKDGTAWKATGGRVLTVVGLGPDLPAARARAYQAVKAVKAPDLRHRTDVAAKVMGRALS
ncbi:MAG: phosphoribosylamine--glycine ligase [Elusimicrobiota bacterium]|nr:phosphoribosylamine--glycine ligase [Elusimicrobiota bacterium]